MVALARAAGLLSPHAPVEWGGLGLDHRGDGGGVRGRGMVAAGPARAQYQAPDEGNTNLLDKVANAGAKGALAAAAGAR